MNSFGFTLFTVQFPLIFFILFWRKYCLHPIPFRVSSFSLMLPLPCKSNGKDQEHFFFSSQGYFSYGSINGICTWSTASHYVGFGQFLGQRQKNAYTTEPHAGWWNRAAVSPQHRTESKSQMVLIWRLLHPYFSIPSTPRLFLQSSGTAHQTINVLKVTPGCKMVLLSW